MRPAVPADAAALSAVIAAAYQPFVDAGLDLPPVAEGTGEDIARHTVWVVEDDVGLQGGIVLALGETAHVVNLAVHPRAGGRGLGRVLMDKAVGLARAAGYDHLQLATHVEMTGTQAFYAKLGWRETGRAGQKVYFSLKLD